MAKRLTKLQVDEVSVVDKGANNKRFLILKQANPDRGSKESESTRKADQPPLLGRARQAPRKVAGTSGRNDGGTDMTPEDVKKAVAEAAGPILGPLYERLEELEAIVTKAQTEDAEPAAVETANDGTTEGLGPDAVRKMVADTVAEVVGPIVSRLEVVEAASGRRQSGLEEQGAHVVRKADGSFSWEGSGLLL
jgi:hypothetical protein